MLQYIAVRCSNEKSYFCLLYGSFIWFVLQIIHQISLRYFIVGLFEAYLVVFCVVVAVVFFFFSSLIEIGGLF